MVYGDSYGVGQRYECGWHDPNSFESELGQLGWHQSDEVTTVDKLSEDKCETECYVSNQVNDSNESELGQLAWPRVRETMSGKLCEDQPSLEKYLNEWLRGLQDGCQEMTLTNDDCVLHACLYGGSERVDDMRAGRDRHASQDCMETGGNMIRECKVDTQYGECTSRVRQYCLDEINSVSVP